MGIMFPTFVWYKTTSTSSIWPPLKSALAFSPGSSLSEHLLRQHRRQLHLLAKADFADLSFYERLGSPKHVLAPMVAQSDLAFRLMCEQQYNVDLSYTQMIHASNFIEPNAESFRVNQLDVYQQSIVRDVLFGEKNGGGRNRQILVSLSQGNALDGLTDDDIELSRKNILTALNSEGYGVPMEHGRVKQTIVQIASHEPEIAVKAAYMILERSGSIQSDFTIGAVSPVAAIDLNLGCPQKIARSGNYGSFLHDENPQSAYNVISRLRSELPPEIGVTAKIRLPPTQADAVAGKLGNEARMTLPPTAEERIHRLIDSGVDLITVHGRTRFENKVAVGAADWEAIHRCVQAAKSYSGDMNFPIFANGGIETFEDVCRCIDETGASGVMSSESLLENPGLFKGADSSGEIITPRRVLERQLGYADMYLDYATLFPPIPGSLGTKGGCFNVIRTHLFKFIHRYLEENPDIRASLGDNGVQTIKEARDMVFEIRKRYNQLSDNELFQRKSSKDESSWYRRHRKPGRDTRALQSSLKPVSATRHMTVEERKMEAKQRILKLREARLKKCDIDIAA
ncbi:hypothetical protein ACHAXS_013223 [Conticribra weissflogii]